jgi:hypothetical protein
LDLSKDTYKGARVAGGEEPIVTGKSHGVTYKSFWDYPQTVGSEE